MNCNHILYFKITINITNDNIYSDLKSEIQNVEIKNYKFVFCIKIIYE